MDNFNENGPFWVDDQTLDQFQTPSRRQGSSHWRVSVRIALTFGILIFIVIYAIFSDVTTLLIIAVIYLAIVAFPYLVSLWAKSKSKDVAKIQELARQRINASEIGSAIHVAGHPFLERDQPVVIALIKGQISFFGYDSSKPINTLDLKAINSLQTVVYDHDRVPHVEVIDSAAQALQMTVTYDSRTWTCLFRRMRPLRPIDWYHAIKQASFMHG
jgi:hypothetical protein